MTIGDILLNPIIPFEVEDEALKKLFSYFLHLAPTIDSRSSRPIPEIGMQQAWRQFLDSVGIQRSEYYMYSSGSKLGDQQLQKYNLDANSSITRRTKRFVGCYKEHETEQLVCLLRHLRNSIAHNYVFVSDGKRKYIVFDDYNSRQNQTARILLLKTDLEKLRRVLSR